MLLSIKPQYADLILSGSKRVEFRRSWAAHEVSKLVIYSSSPIQRLMGIVDVEGIISASTTALWPLSVERGGGLTRQELRNYFSGKAQGVGVLLGTVQKFKVDIDPSEVFANFVPPQSFRYVNDADYLKLKMKL